VLRRFGKRSKKEFDNRRRFALKRKQFQPLKTMKSIRPLLLAISGGLSLTSLQAATTAGFDGGPDTPLTLQQFGAPPGPSIQSTGGNPGGFLQLTAPVNSQHNWATFDQTDTGPFNSSTFSFQFRIQAPITPSADGFSFSYANTGIYGTSGGIAGPPFTAEDPAAAGILGFGFDTWSNRGIPGSGQEDPASPDDPAQPQGSDYQEISLFYNGALISRVNDTRMLGLTLDDGQWHTAAGGIDFQNGSASLTVDGRPIFSNIDVPGLTTFDSRIMLAARTGGENELAAIDNISVLWTPVPEPSTVALSVLGIGLILLVVSKRGRARS
jgi:hypothetical protein